MIKDYGYETAEQTRTFDTYNDVDCWNYSDVHDYIKWLKYGYGKVVDHASREIRLGHMTRDEGLELAEFYLSQEPKNLRLFLEWMGITENAFHYLVDQHRNVAIWHRDEDWKWNLKRALSGSKAGDSDDVFLANRKRLYKPFDLTSKGFSSDKVAEYILVGKGVG